MATKKKAAASTPPAKRAAPKAEVTAAPHDRERRLTLKQEAFCREFLANGGNASEAYRKAYDASGMSAGAIATEAHRVLQNPQVSRMIADEREKLAKSYGIDANRIVKELARIALADVRKAVTWSGKEHREETKGGKVIVRAANDVLLRGSDEIDDETAAAIAEVVQTKDGARVRFHDKAAAIAQLTRILGLTDDTRESGNITVQIMNFSTMPQPVPPLERKEAPTIERMRSQQQRGRGNG